MKRTTNGGLLALLIAGMLAVSSTVVHAGGYIGVDGASIALENTVDGELNPRGLRLKLGSRISQGFDIEAHLGSGSDSNSDNFDKFRTTFVGVYLKGYLPVGERSAFFGLVGGAGVELTQTIAGSEFGDDRSGFSYGIGLETQLSQNLDLSGDFMRYSLDDDAFSAIDAFSLGLKWYF